MAPTSKPIELSPRQKQIVSLMRRGFPAKLIGSRLGISIETVRKYQMIIYLKTGTHSALQLVATIPVEMIAA